LLSRKRVATPPTAPGLLITLTVQPVDFAISPAIARMMVSVPPPAEYMTTAVTGRSGHWAAPALRLVRTRGDAAAAPRPSRVCRRVQGVMAGVDFLTLSPITASLLSRILSA
jgi:hypothetical protein